MNAPKLIKVKSYDYKTMRQAKNISYNCSINKNFKKDFNTEII